MCMHDAAQALYNTCLREAALSMLHPTSQRECCLGEAIRDDSSPMVLSSASSWDCSRSSMPFTPTAVSGRTLAPLLLLPPPGVPAVACPSAPSCPVWGTRRIILTSW